MDIVHFLSDPTMPEPTPAVESRGNAIIGVLGVLVGVFVLASLVVGFLEPSPSPLGTYSAYLSHVNVYWTSLILTVFAGMVGVPFFAGVGRLLESRSTSVARAATFATITGILVAVLGSVVTTGAYWSISQVPVGSTYQSNAAFEAAVWNNLTFVFSFLGFGLVGVGLLLFGWLAWKSTILPNWLAILAFIGGVAGLLFGAAVSNTPAGFLGYIGFILVLVTFLVWGFVIGIRLLSTPRASEAT
jgi:hypothetical protein